MLTGNTLQPIHHFLKDLIIRKMIPERKVVCSFFKTASLNQSRIIGGIIRFSRDLRLVKALDKNPEIEEVRQRRT